MAELILNDPIAVRRCILSEFLSGEPIWTCFSNFCYKLGQNSIEYQEFEYWFMRFARKEFELSYDRSKNPPTRSFFDLPPKILQKVLSGINGKQRRTSSLVCKKLKEVISTIIAPYKIFRVNINNSFTLLTIDDSFNYYSDGLGNEGFDTEMIFGDAIPQKQYENENDHQEMVLKDVHTFLNQPMLELGKLEIPYVPGKYWEDFRAMFGRLHQKVKTKEVHIGTSKRMEELQILPCLDPSFIENIYLGINDATKERMDKIQELKQCQHVKMIEFHLELEGFNNFQVENFMKFRRFALIFRTYDMDIDKFMTIVKTLLTSTSLELVQLDCSYPNLADPIKRELDKITEEVPGNSRIRKFMIPDSKECFETELIRGTVIRIGRKQ